MTRAEADKIIKRLSDGCIYHRFDEPGVMAEYQRFLLKFSFDIMARVVDEIFEEDSKNVPPISVLVKTYKKLSGTNIGSLPAKNEQYCEVCADNGLVLMTEVKDKMPYQYALYCPFCNIGRSFAYDGRNCKDHKSEYIIPPLTQYFDNAAIADMKRRNRQKQAESKMTLSEIAELFRNTKITGLDIPELKTWERGDAWEPPENEDDAECPF
jgi:hypothetical protein